MTATKKLCIYRANCIIVDFNDPIRRNAHQEKAMLNQLDMFTLPTHPLANPQPATRKQATEDADGFDFTDMREIPHTHKEWYEHRNGLKVRNLRLSLTQKKKWHFEVTNGIASILLCYEQWPTMHYPVAIDAPKVFIELGLMS